MDAEQLASWLADHLPGIAGLNLSPSTRVTHILNWGGFVNHSFFVEDVPLRYHLKLTNDAGSIAKLRQWQRIHKTLEERYRAPKLIQWIDFPEIKYAGLIFEHLDGATADLVQGRPPTQQLIDLMNHLHADRELYSALHHRGKTYLDHFVETYIDRFTGDLETIQAAQIPFIFPRLIEWMKTETNRLETIASNAPSFHKLATEPVHGDLNQFNVIVTPARWFVVDWDDLAIGDPAIDFAILLWPLVWEGQNWRDCLPGRDEAFSERMELSLRAQLLDDVIDSLADYAEAGAVPSRQGEVRAAKRKQHQDALARYRTLWPSQPA